MSTEPSRTRIGIDLGGTKIEALALGPAGEELYRERILTPRHDYKGTIRAIRGLVERAEQHIGHTATVGIATPGAISPQSGRLKNANSTWLNGQFFKQDLEAALAREVRLANDGNCLAVSEAIDGAGAGRKVVFAVILGTGVGGGLAWQGQVHDGINAIAGEFGHTALPWLQPDEYPGPVCYCGRQGCVERWLCGPALEEQYRQMTGQSLKATAIAEAAAGGDSQAVAMMAIYKDRLARALSTIVNLVDPDMIVLGGGLSKIGSLYADLPSLLPQWCFSDRIDTPIVAARHGDSSGVRGAAWLWPL
jgi:fructokinase